MARRSIADSRVLITGATSGIGLALARELAARRAKLVLNGRREERLVELTNELNSRGGSARRVAGDVTQADVRARLLDHATAAYGGLDVLVNNAGAGAIGRFEQAEEARLRRIMEVNFFAPVELIRQALPILAGGRRPAIVNIVSILGHRGIPRHTEYCASKFALRGFSESLRAELAPRGIDLIVVSPGTTDTEFFEHLLEDRGTAWKKKRGASPTRVAKRIVRAIALGRHEIVPSADGRLLVWLNRLSPRLADAVLARYA